MQRTQLLIVSPHIHRTWEVYFSPALYLPDKVVVTVSVDPYRPSDAHFSSFPPPAGDISANSIRLLTPPRSRMDARFCPTEAEGFLRLHSPVLSPSVHRSRARFCPYLLSPSPSPPPSPSLSEPLAVPWIAASSFGHHLDTEASVGRSIARWTSSAEC